MGRLLTIIELVVLLTGLLGFPSGVHGQCNQGLSETATELAGTDAIFVRSFNVKLSSGNMKNPTPVDKFSVYLNKGVDYRFTVANALDFDGRVYFELNRNGQKYADNYPMKPNVYLNSIDFECPRSATYQLRAHFGQGREGCAALVLSMVYRDSMEYIEPGARLKSDSAEVLYLWSKHKIQVASSESRNADFKLTLSQGGYEKKGKYYWIEPEHVGPLNIKVEVFENGVFIESDSVNYQVAYPPLPRLSFTGDAYTIKKNLLSGLRDVELVFLYKETPLPYKLKSFYLADNSAGFNREESVNGRLSARQLKMLHNTRGNGVIYIIDAEFIDPFGNIHTKENMEMIVLE